MRQSRLNAEVTTTLTVYDDPTHRAVRELHGVVRVVAERTRAELDAMRAALVAQAQLQRAREAQ